MVYLWEACTEVRGEAVRVPNHTVFPVFEKLALPKVSYAKYRSVGASYMCESWSQYEYQRSVRVEEMGL